MLRKQTLTVMANQSQSFLNSLTLQNPISSLSSHSQQQNSTELTNQLYSILVSQPKWYSNPLLKTLLPFVSSSHVSSLLTRNLQPKTALQFFDLVSQRHGFKHDVGSHSSLLNVLISNGLFLAAERIWISMVNSCGSTEDARFAFGVLTRRYSGFKINVSCYNLLLALLCRFSMLSEMRIVVLDMFRSGVSPDLFTLNLMVKACCSFGNVVEADMYLGKMIRVGFCPDSDTYSSMILGRCRNNEVDYACKVFEKMRILGHNSTNAYENLIVGLCKVGRFDEAFEFFSEMKIENRHPSIIIYNSIIRGFCAIGRRKEGMDLCREMRENGFVAPNVDTYSVLVHSMCKDSEFDEACDMIGEMKENGFSPKVETYNALICGYCNEKQFDKAMTLLIEMLEKKLSPNLRSYNLLIRGHCESGDLDSACTLLKLMNTSGSIADQSTYGILIESLIKNGNLKDATKIFESLDERGVEQSDIVYNALVNGYCSVGRINEALTLFRSGEFSPNINTYNALITGLRDEKRFRESSAVLESMLNMYTNLCVTSYRLLIKDALTQGELEIALKLLDRVISIGFQPDSCVYNSFISAFCNVGAIDRAEDMITKMNKGVSPDSTSYTLLVNAYGRLGSIDSAFGVLKGMNDSGCDPSCQTYLLLIKHLTNRYTDDVFLESVTDFSFRDTVDVLKTMDFNDALQLFDKMSKHGCVPTLSTYEKLIIGLCKENRKQVAQSLFSHMKKVQVSRSEDIYNALFGCCCELGLCEEAIEFVDDMIEKSYIPSLEHSRLLFCRLSEDDNRERAKSVFNTLVTSCKYNNYDEVARKLLIEGLLERDHVDTCFELLCTMENMGYDIDHETYSVLLDGINRKYWNFLFDLL